METLSNKNIEIKRLEDTTDEDFQDDYEVLRPDARAKKFKNQNPNAKEVKIAVLEDYLTQFDKLVAKIQGHEDFNSDQPYDTVIFLDKSARPLAWMLSELWSEFAEPIQNEDGEKEMPPKPSSKFLNIDRLLWRRDADVEGEFHETQDTDIKALREIFQIGSKNELDGTPEHPKRILIVDEISESGDTQRIAKELVSKAAQNAQIETFVYMPAEKHDTKGGISYEYASFPTWYPAKDSEGFHPENGRGVLDPQVWQADASLDDPRHRNKFLSSPPKHALSAGEMREKTIPLLKELEELGTVEETPEIQARKNHLTLQLSKYTVGRVVRDIKAEKLRRDVKRLGRDFRAGRLMPVVTADRSNIGPFTANEYYSRRKSRVKPVKLIESL